MFKGKPNGKAKGLEFLEREERKIKREKKKRVTRKKRKKFSSIYQYSAAGARKFKTIGHSE